MGQYKAYASIVGQVDWSVSVRLELVMVLHSCLYNEFIRISPMWHKHGQSIVHNNHVIYVVNRVMSHNDWQLQ